MPETNQPIQKFTDLRAWQEAHQLALLVYRLSKDFPKEELFSLVNQMRRAVVSITSNIAEGFGRQHYAEKIQFYSIAQGSNTESQNQLLLARDIGYISKENCTETLNRATDVHKMLNGLIKSSRIRNS